MQQHTRLHAGVTGRTAYTHLPRMARVSVRIADRPAWKGDSPRAPPPPSPSSMSTCALPTDAIARGWPAAAARWMEGRGRQPTVSKGKEWGDGVWWVSVACCRSVPCRFPTVRNVCRCLQSRLSPKGVLATATSRDFKCVSFSRLLPPHQALP